MRGTLAFRTKLTWSWIEFEPRSPRGEDDAENADGHAVIYDIRLAEVEYSPRNQCRRDSRYDGSDIVAKAKSGKSHFGREDQCAKRRDDGGTGHEHRKTQGPPDQLSWTA